MPARDVTRPRSRTTLESSHALSSWRFYPALLRFGPEIVSSSASTFNSAVSDAEGSGSSNSLPRFGSEDDPSGLLALTGVVPLIAIVVGVPLLSVVILIYCWMCHHMSRMVLEVVLTFFAWVLVYASLAYMKVPFNRDLFGKGLLVSVCIVMYSAFGRSVMKACHDNVVWSLLDTGDLENLQAFTPPHFAWLSIHEDDKITPLQKAALAGISSEDFDPYFRVIEWVVGEGADPAQQAPVSCTYGTDLWKNHDKKGTRVHIDYKNHSAVSLVLSCRKCLEHEMSQKGKQQADWTREIEYLKGALARMAKTEANVKPPRITISRSVLELWESLCHCSKTHNVTFETSDGQVTAHDLVLQKASPVLDAMLFGSLVEARRKTIDVKDASSSGVSLFLEVLYTGCTCNDLEWETVLTAMDLAHRWAVDYIVVMLSGILQTLINDENFVAITEAAAYKGPDTLRKACRMFGNNNKTVQAQLKAGKLPRVVQDLLGVSEGLVNGQKKRRLATFDADEAQKRKKLVAAGFWIALLTDFCFGAEEAEICVPTLFVMLCACKLAYASCENYIDANQGTEFELSLLSPLRPGPKRRQADLTSVDPVPLQADASDAPSSSYEMLEAAADLLSKSNKCPDSGLKGKGEKWCDPVRMGGFKRADPSLTEQAVLMRQVSDEIMDLQRCATFREIWEDVTEGLAFLENLALGSTPALCFAIGWTLKSLRTEIRPVLPGGMELYHWFYFRWKDGAVPRAEVDESAQMRAAVLLRCGLESTGCLQSMEDAAQQAPEAQIRSFMERGCHIFWQQLVMIEAEIGSELARRGDVRPAAWMLRNASEHFSQMMRHPYFARFPWQRPHDMNYNHEMFPSPGPVWPSKMLPIESWLEEHFTTFRGELDALLQHAGLFDALHEAERNAEESKGMSRLHFNIAGRAKTTPEIPTGELLQRRPEFQCDHAAAYINRMRPGAWIKPHMGGPPRLVAHLGHLGDKEAYRAVCWHGQAALADGTCARH
ncbi:asphd2 [Symbiodinium sp. KB8]|nr:asphd2 [Symbiodinium sp. KB8]